MVKLLGYLSLVFVTAENVIENVFSDMTDFDLGPMLSKLREEREIMQMDIHHELESMRMLMRKFLITIYVHLI